MAGVKMMAFAQPLALAEPIENAVGDIEQPGAKGQQQRREQRQCEDAWRGRRTTTRERRRLAHPG